LTSLLAVGGMDGIAQPLHLGPQPLNLPKGAGSEVGLVRDKFCCTMLDSLGQPPQLLILLGRQAQPRRRACVNHWPQPPPSCLASSPTASSGCKCSYVHQEEDQAPAQFVRTP